jgi:hypothetical protein
MGQAINVQHAVRDSGVLDYYSKKFEGEILAFTAPGWYPTAAKHGHIDARKNGVQKRILVSDELVQVGFKGMETLVLWMRDNWDFIVDGSIANVHDQELDPELADRKHYWRAYFGVYSGYE